MALRKYTFIIAIVTVCLKYTFSVTSDFRPNVSTWRTCKNSNGPTSASSGRGHTWPCKSLLSLFAIATVCLKYTFSVTSDFRPNVSTWRTGRRQLQARSIPLLEHVTQTNSDRFVNQVNFNNEMDEFSTGPQNIPPAAFHLTRVGFGNFSKAPSMRKQ